MLLVYTIACFVYCRCYDSLTFTYNDTSTVQFGALMLCGNENFEDGSNIFPGEFEAVFRTGEPDVGSDTGDCRSILTSSNYTGFELHSLCFNQTGIILIVNLTITFGCLK